MQFSTILMALFAATALAAPVNMEERNPNIFGDAVNAVKDGVSDVKDDVEKGAKAVKGAVTKGASEVEDAAKKVPGELASEGKQLFGANCDFGKCAAALGPEAASCGGAAVQGFADPFTDVACVATALNNAANKPASCKQCHAPSFLIKE